MPILRPYADRELRAARLRLLRLRDELCLIRRDHFHRKYNPNQPRVPSGNAGGGQWTSGAGGGGFGGGAGGGDPLSPDGSALDADTGWSSLDEGWNEDGSIFEQTVTDGEGTTIRSEYAASRAAGFDERQTVIQPDGNKTSFETTGNVQSIYQGGPDGDLVARTIWTPSGPEPDATVQPAFAPLLAAPTILLGGAILFNWQSPLNGSDGQQAVMGFNARDYQPGDGTAGKFDLTYSGRITEEQAGLACRRLPEVREFADRAANAAGSPDLYPSRTVYGTDVHARFAQYVKDLNDFRFRAERSFLKEHIEGVDNEKVPYGYPRSIRVDAYEYRDDGTLCVYDLKTGKAGLSDRRADILVNATRLGFDPVRRIIVMEVRPRQ